jgi:hypothetical protein
MWPSKPSPKESRSLGMKPFEFQGGMGEWTEQPIQPPSWGSGADRISGSTCVGGEPGKRKTGRPSSTGKPWEAEGISRQAWYKRQKKSKGDV